MDSPNTTTTPDPKAEAARKLDERRKAVVTGIFDALKQLGHATGGSEPSLIDGVYIHLAVTEDHKSYSNWHRTYGTGRLRVKFGGYGNVRQFPEPKAGFTPERLAQIAGEISNYVSQLALARVRQQEAAARYESGKAVAERINSDLGLPPYRSPRAESTGNGLRVCIDKICTEAQARALLAAYKEIFRQGPDAPPMGL